MAAAGRCWRRLASSCGAVRPSGALVDEAAQPALGRAQSERLGQRLKGAGLVAAGLQGQRLEGLQFDDAARSPLRGRQGEQPLQQPERPPGCPLCDRRLATPLLMRSSRRGAKGVASPLGCQLLRRAASRTPDLWVPESRP
jgi:hypothetical protein